MDTYPVSWPGVTPSTVHVIPSVDVWNCRFRATPVDVLLVATNFPSPGDHARRPIVTTLTFIGDCLGIHREPSVLVMNLFSVPVVAVATKSPSVELHVRRDRECPHGLMRVSQVMPSVDVMMLNMLAVVATATNWLPHVT